MVVASGLLVSQFASWILGAAGFVLEAIIKLSILEINTYLAPGGAISTTWGAFRDLANMAFIFVILYIAIGTMLGTGVDMKKMLARVIIVALLLNFSMFFTRLAIDASNILTVAFYNEIVKSSPCVTGTVAQNGGIGAAFVCKLGVADVFSTETSNALLAYGGGWKGAMKNFMLTILGSVFMVITAFVLLATAVFLIARLVAFIFLVLLSPIAFISTAIPNQDDLFDKWKGHLISNCLFAPVLMAFLWAVLQVATALPEVSDLGKVIIGTTEGQALPEMGQVLLSYAILITLMIYSLTLAKDFGGAGVKIANKYVEKARKNVQGFVGRNTLGWVGNKIDKSLDGREGRVGRLMNTRTGNIVRGATVGALAKSGFGSKLSYKTLQDERKSANETYATKITKSQREGAKAEFEAAKQKLDSLQATRTSREKLVLPSDKAPLEKIKEYQKEKDDLTKQQLFEQDKLRTDTTLNQTQRTEIEVRVKDRAAKINEISNKIQAGPEAVSIEKNRQGTEQSLKNLDKQIGEAKTAFEKLTNITDEEGKKLFEDTGKEKEVTERGKTYGLSSTDLAEFVKMEREKFLEALKKEGKDGFIKKQLIKNAAEFNKPIMGMLSQQKKALVKSLRDNKKDKDEEKKDEKNKEKAEKETEKKDTKSLAKRLEKILKSVSPTTNDDEDEEEGEGKADEKKK